MARNRIVALALLVTLPTVSAPAASAQEPEQGTFNFVLENDLFTGLDRDYTNGILFSWTSGPDQVPSWVIDAAHLFPLFPETGKVRASFALGQSMYTPSDITLRDPPAEDRPYAGWLYGAVGLIAETGSRLDQLQLQLGVVGPAALAGETQAFVHSVIGADKPRGWDKQLDNEPGAVLTYQRSWRAFVSGEFLGFSFDATPHIGGALGNVFTYANTGATLRLGWNLPNDYGPPRIEPSLPGSGFFEPREGLGMYVFAGLDGRVVARNIFLDGNTWQDSRSVEKEPLVGDAQVGFAVTLGAARLAYTHVFRTREFESQRGTDKFGAISLSIQY